MKRKLIIRWGLFLIGIIILTFGARMILLSELGVGGLDAIAIGLSKLTGNTIGTMISILGFTIILVGNVLSRKINLFPLGVSLLIGECYDLWGILVFNQIDLEIRTPYSGYLFLGGILIAPLGAALYISSKLSTGPVDYLMLSIKSYFKGSIQNSRIFIETLFVIIGCLVGGPIGVGTICIMLFWGPILQVYCRVIEKIIRKYIRLYVK